MVPFRTQTPKHRPKRKVCKNYKQYKKTLREDFKNRCGYCNESYSDHKKYFVIDHFVPQNPTGWTHSIPPNKYKNLIYACSYCNSFKSNKWPTNDPKISNDGNNGFIKPTFKKYAELFRRNDDGSIVVHKNNPIARYIHRELNFDLEIHSLNWKFETLFKQEKELIEIYKSTKNKTIKDAIDVIKGLRLSVMDNRDIFFNG